MSLCIMLSCFKLFKTLVGRVLCAIKRLAATLVLYRIKHSYSCFEYYIPSSPDPRYRVFYTPGFCSRKFFSGCLNHFHYNILARTRFPYAVRFFLAYRCCSYFNAVQHIVSSGVDQYCKKNINC